MFTVRVTRSEFTHSLAAEVPAVFEHTTGHVKVLALQHHIGSQQQNLVYAELTVVVPAART